MSVPAFIFSNNIRIVNGVVKTAAATADETTDAVMLPDNFHRAVVTINCSALATPNAADEVDFYIQTSYDGGKNWHALADIHFTNTDDGTTPVHVIFLSDPSTTVTNITPSATVGDDAVNSTVPIGDRIRIFLDLTITGAISVTYSAQLLAKG